LEELLVIAIQGLLQLLVESIVYIPFDWPSKNRVTPDPQRVWPKAGILFFVGCVFGGLSVFVFEHSLLTLSAFRVTNLVAAPLCSAFLSKAIANRRRDTNANIIPRNHFWQAFWFTLGLVMVRFAYVEH
jgi:hypothetical protein